MQNPTTIHTIIPVYWVQSVLIGFFNFIDLLTMRSDNAEKGSGLAFFFLVHYGGFHFGYLIFMFVRVVEPKLIDLHLLGITFIIVFLSMFVSFVRDKIRFGRREGNPMTIMMLPYLRIIPMHLTIIIPAFIHISSFGLFLFLKTICDVICYLLYSRLRYKHFAIAE
jgi:hypothetical protein